MGNEMENKMEIKVVEFTGFDLENRFKRQRYAETVEAVLDKYEKLQAEGTSFIYTFPMCTPHGILYGYDNEVKLRLVKGRVDKGTTIPYLLKGATSHKSAGDSYDVIVQDVDREQKMVFLAINYGDNGQRAELVNALVKGVEEQRYVRVPATIVKFIGKDRETGESNGSMALLNIGNMGIAGVVRRVEWSTAKTKAISYAAKPGDVIDVVVKGTYKWDSGTVFDCSRREIMEIENINPWAGIEQRISKNTKVNILCVERREKNFFGVVDSLKDIEILCQYPDSGSSISIEVGKKYIGKVYLVSEERQMLCARIMEELS